MNFLESFRQSVRSNRMVNTELRPEALIPNIYQYVFEENTSGIKVSDLLHLLAGGNIHIDFPVSFSFQSMECYLLLHTVNGGGQISSMGRTVSATDSQLILFHCDHPFFLRSLVHPWTFKIFFFAGADIEPFSSVLMSNSHIPCFSIPELSGINRSFRTLLSIPSASDIPEIIQMHHSLTEILSELSLTMYRNKICSSPHPVPDYIFEMWDTFERHYEESFTLEYFETLFGINKYRLCREFSSAYGMPPLKYLINRRLKEAQKMLLTTDLTIQEISSKIGYENTTHFINIFKKYMGLPPKVFRQKTREAQSALHFPSQQIYPEA